jgi:hypothetical protein
MALALELLRKSKRLMPLTGVILVFSKKGSTRQTLEFPSDAK